jgi:hypothetical protein
MRQNFKDIQQLIVDIVDEKSIRCSLECSEPAGRADGGLLLRGTVTTVTPKHNKVIV